MDCRHVWSLANEFAMTATCLRCGQTRSLEELLAAGLRSMELGEGKEDAEIEADFARLREKVRKMGD